MPFYYSIRSMSGAERKRTLQGLARLRKQLDLKMPQKTRDATLVLGTWNIRNFDDNRFMNGKRSKEDLFYIAEILARFDVIAIQEVCDSLYPLDQVMKILGGDYDYILTDVTEGRGGNGERLGFIFDKKKVSFKGVAGELVLPDSMQIVADGKKRQFSRTPFQCYFQSNWFRFMFSTVHIYFGKPSGEKYRRRVEEIEKVAKFLAKRAKSDKQNHILVGDFNIVAPGSDGYNALEKRGFDIFQNKAGSNKDQTKFYDQISFKARKEQLRLTNSDRNQGVLQFFDSVYREQDFTGYKTVLKNAVKAKIVKIKAEIVDNQAKLARTNSAKTRATLTKKIAKQKAGVIDWTKHLSSDPELKKYYMNEWRTFHGSDHLPLWVELEIDFSDDYLATLAAPAPATP